MNDLKDIKNTTGKILSVDFGDARTGLAVNVPGTSMAVGAGCIKSTNFRKTAEEVVRVAAEQNAVKLVVGIPLNMNGTEGPRAERCRNFAALVGELSGLPVEMLDERLTTVSAHNFLSASGVSGKKRKENVDELSATLILQNYMDRHK